MKIWSSRRNKNFRHLQKMSIMKHNVCLYFLGNFSPEIIKCNSFPYLFLCVSLRNTTITKLFTFSIEYISRASGYMYRILWTETTDWRVTSCSPVHNGRPDTFRYCKTNESIAAAGTNNKLSHYNSKQQIVHIPLK